METDRYCILCGKKLECMGTHTLDCETAIFWRYFYECTSCKVYFQQVYVSDDCPRLPNLQQIKPDKPDKLKGDVVE